MRNNGSKKTPVFRANSCFGDNYPKKRFQGFCNAFLAFCNGITNINLIAASNESDGGEYAEHDFGEICAENESAEGWYLIAPFGEFKHKVGIQSFDTTAANEIVGNFNSCWERLKRAVGFGTVVPVYYGHPDVDSNGRPGVSSRHFDQTVYGKVSELATSQEGLKAKIDWSDDFKKLPSGLRFSPFWFMKTISKGIHRPVFLKSIGLTYSPNIPATSAANEVSYDIHNNNSLTNQQKENQMLIELLTLLGFSQEQAQKFVNKSEGAPTEDEIKTKIKAIFANATNAENAKVAQETAEKNLEQAQVSAANSREAFADYVVNKAIAEGKLTEADRVANKDKLLKADDITTAANEIDALEARISTGSETGNLQKSDAKATAKKVFNELVAKYESEGMSHFDATMRAKREIPEQHKLAFD